MVETSLYERNERLIRERLEKQIMLSLNKGNKYIDKELSGPFNFVLREAVKMFYNGIKKGEMASGTRDQISVIMRAAKEAVENPKTPIEEICEKYFQNYLKSDQTTSSLRKTHRNYRWCVNNLKNTFKAQLEPLVEMLQCDQPDIYTYLQLSQATFKTREGVMKAMMGQLEYMELALKKIKQDLSILDLPVGRDILFKVLRGGYDETWADLRKEVNSMDFN